MNENTRPDDLVKPLLHGTDVDKRTHRLIRGRVARAGGTVDQLINYQQCFVEDINIPDGGFGKVFKNGVSSIVLHTFPFLKRFIRQETLFLFQGHRICRDRKTIILDMHNAHKNNKLHDRYDCAISSNLLEHSPNPIWLLLNFYIITRKNGYQFHAIPHYRYTYDRFRTPTPVEHFIEDFEKQTDASDMRHVEDYRQSAVEKDGWQKKFHEKYSLEYPFIHFHVFDENNTKELMELMFEEVVSDVLKTNVYSDNVVIFKNKLNPRFIEKYKNILSLYSVLLDGNE